MADVAKNMYGPAQPATTNAVIYTPPSTGAIVRNIHVANTTGSAATISLAIGGTAATAANCLLSALSIPANSTYDWSGFLVLTNASSTLNALQGTTSALTVTISGVEI